MAKAAAGSHLSTARDGILARIRAVNSSQKTDDRAELRERIARHPRQIEPAFDENPAQRFCAKLEAAGATIDRVASIGEVVAAIAAYLDQAGVDKRLVVSGDSLIAEIEWPPAFEVESRTPTGADLVGLTSVLCAIAETGTMMLTSGDDRPTSLNFLPDFHIVVLRENQLVARMEDAWDKLRAVSEKMPRSVNFISGPSKTADIEQTVEYGAHGPRCLHVVVVA